MPSLPIRGPHYCADCGKPFYSRAAHTEECSGPRVFPCDARATSPERRCKLPYGHVGPHEWRRGL